MSHYHHMGAVTSSVPFVDTPTAEKDGFASLLAAYKSAFPSGTFSPVQLTAEMEFAKAVCAANGIPYTITAVEDWIFGLSGKRHPFVKNNSPQYWLSDKNTNTSRVPTRLKGVGWAYFGAGNRIKLPNIPRPGVNPPAGSPPVDPVLPVDPITQQSAEETPWWKSPWVIGAGVCAVIAVVSMSSDEDAKT